AAAPVGAPDGQAAILDEEPPRRRFRDLFRRRDEAPADTAPIAETALAPAAGAAVAAAPAAVASAAAPVAESATPAIVEPPRERRSFRDLFRRRDPEPDTTLIPLPDATGAPSAATAPLQATGTQPLP